MKTRHTNSLAFSYTEPLPMIPLRFILKNNESTPLMVGILDSGSNEIAIPLKIAQEYNFELNKRPPSFTAGGKVQSFSSHVNINIGIPQKEIEFKNIEICVLDTNIPILVGIYPLFLDCKVSIDGLNKKILLLKN